MTPPEIPPVINAPGRTTLRYSITRWDILRWQLHVLVRNRALLVFWLVISLGLVWNDLRTAEMAVRPTGFKIFYAIFLPLAMLCVMALVTTTAMGCMVAFKKFSGLLGEHELEIRDDGLVERTDVNESVHRWAGFHKIVSTGRYLYIYVTDHNVHVVPLRCFESEQAQKAFQDAIQRRINPN